MPGIHPSIASHRLNVMPSSRPIQQKVRRFHPDRQKIIQAKVDKLLAVGFIREVEYPDLLANVIVVPKNGRKWQVCVDYTNLNDACPKDSFRLPWIDQIVDSTIRHGMLSFLYAFFRVPPNSYVSTRWRKNRLHNTAWTLLLQSHAVWAQECWSHLPKAYDKDLQTFNRTLRRGVYWRHCGKEQN